MCNRFGCSAIRRKFASNFLLFDKRDLVALDDALQDLAKLKPEHSQIVELRFFGGLTFEEVGEMLDISPRTAQREWRMARAWLRRVVFPEDSRNVAGG